MSKSPKDRRRHRVFATKFTEYHLREDECVGVRDRESGAWFRDHAALRLRAIQLPQMGDDPRWVGRRIQFWGRLADVVTSPVVEVGRPERWAVGNYISQAVSGEIAA
ncbi:MAG: hypothetical protein KC486_27870 [Myxococcales bacterium]|nr:hypothetical protein [Myxococcales bacterium]